MSSNDRYQVPMGGGQVHMVPSRSAAAITGFVLGVLALVGSWVPIFNNFAFILGFIGLIFAIVGVVACVRGTRAGKGLAIAALILNVVACAVVLATQSIYVAAIDDAAESLENPATGISTAGTPDSDDSANDGEAVSGESSYTDLALGTAVDFANGLSVSVDSVQNDLVNYDGSVVTGVYVTYVNNGDDAESFNVYDWQGQDAQGVLSHQTYYSEAEKELGSGELTPGGTVSGYVYFEGNPEKAVYSASLFSDASASWLLA